MWQDYVFLVGGIAFIASLIPSVIKKDKPNRWTSLSTGAMLYAYVISYFTLGLKYAGITTAITATLWIVMFIQVIKRNSKNENWRKNAKNGENGR